MKELSIFVDESGDFGKYSENCPYYIISLVLHNQKNCIKEQVAKLDLSLADMGLVNYTIHAGPLIRREKSYVTNSLEDRRKIFNKLFHFTRNVDIKYKNFVVEKRQCKNILDITATISKQLSAFIKENLEYFNKYDKIIIYYDNGQIQLTNILVSIFSTFFIDNCEFRNVLPRDYKLFQLADLICTLALILHKLDQNKKLSQSELLFFESANKFKKNYIKQIQRKSF